LGTRIYTILHDVSLLYYSSCACGFRIARRILAPRRELRTHDTCTRKCLCASALLIECELLPMVRY